jgi:hypothetical protein
MKTEEQFPTNLIERNTYINRINPFIGKQIIKALTGWKNRSYK